LVNNYFEDRIIWYFYPHFLYFFANSWNHSMNAGYFIRKRFVNYGMNLIDLIPDSLLARNTQLKNIHDEERCFILGSGHTVITQCITIALYMGFRKIYLVGFDLDQICQLTKGRDNVRFYGHSQITRNEAEKNYETSYASSGFDFFNQWMIWRQLNLLKEY